MYRSLMCVSVPVIVRLGVMFYAAVRDRCGGRVKIMMSVPAFRSW
jgi:hypothetical protein